MINRTPTASLFRALSVSSLKRSLTGLSVALAGALSPVAVLGQDLPTGGSVVHGNAQITTPNANTMTINQGSDRAVVNWDGFSIGTGKSVNINQPNVNSAILNRVTGDTTSQIHGQLNANGRVFVVNPNGIFIGPTGSVNAGGFVASTLGIRTDDFVTGKIVFEGNGSSATVSNAGNIQVVTGGYAALIGGKVKNSGTIQAPLGFVGLGSGERITLDLAGDGFLQVAVPTNSDDEGLEALIENSGTIQANGGTVQISAATARNAARQAINMSGVVEARTVSGRNGRVTLGGGLGGKVKVSGKVRTNTYRRPAIQVTQSARPALRPERGGDITITGRDISLAGANIDASGTNGGGNVRIGGNMRGAPGLMTADTLHVDSNSVISADATVNGDGGRVIAWSDLSTDFSGDIYIRGGNAGGNGGFAEVSGKIDLNYAGFTNALAPNGSAGELLLDPADIEIVSGTPVFNQILDTDLEAQLAFVNVTIETSAPNLPTIGQFPSSTLGFGEQPGDLGTITVVSTASVEWNSGTTLQMIADGDIILNGPVTPNAGTLDLTAANRVVVNGDVDAPSGTINVNAAADFTVAGSGEINATNGIINANAADIIINGDVIAPGADALFLATNDFSLNSAYDVTGANLTVGADTVNMNAMTSGNGGDISLRGDTTLNIGADITIPAFGILSLNSNGPINVGAPITMPGGELTIGSISTPTVNVGLAGAIETGLFRLSNGSYAQNGLGSGLAAFSADNFVIDNPLASGFQRVLDGSGTLADPFLLTDAFGLQGVGTLGFAASSFALANDIDASPTQTWESLAPPVNGQRNSGLVPLSNGGVFDGRGFEISDLRVLRYNGIAGSNRAGLFDTNNGTVQNLTFSNATVAGSIVGIVAADNFGLIDGVSVNGTVQVHVEGGETSVGGGIVAANGDGSSLSGTISNSRAVNLTLTDVPDPSLVAPGLGEDVFVGGIAGVNRTNSQIDQVKTSGSISLANVEFAGRIGGIAGESDGEVRDTYTTASVSADTTNGPLPDSFVEMGGIVGDNFGVIRNTLANGPVTLTGTITSGDVGAIAGADIPSATSMLSSYFNPGVTGQPASGQNGEIDTGGIPFQGARAQTTAQLNDAVGFVADAIGAGWDFVNIWAFPQDGVDHARLYSLDPVISAEDLNLPSFVYNGTTTGFTANGTFGGGPAAFRFDDPADTGLPSTMNSQIVLSDQNVGPVTFTFPTTFTSDLGQVYNVRSLPSAATVTPAPLTVNVNNTQKAFGDVLTFADVSFTALTLLGADTITGADVVSPGAPASAPASNTPYPLSLTNFTGVGAGNYTITVVPGNLRVVSRTLNITVNDATKTYGTDLVFNGTEFTVTGLINADTVTSLTITSNGAPATAQVANGPFAINGSNPVGTGLGNYTLNIIPGQLVINPAPLTITADDQSKPFGTTFTFVGNEFTTTGLLNSDTVTSATLSSAAAAANAPFTGPAGEAILITNPVGAGLDNYTISRVNGVMFIAPDNLVITANDQTKTYGDDFVFDGTEFSVVGLAPGDSVDRITLASAGAAATAQVADGPFTITATSAVGTGLEKYTLVFADGTFSVVPAPLSIRANDQSKQQGQVYTFAGTEFTTNGLLNSDTVDSAVLTSAGAAATASAANSPYVIAVGTLTGSGLGNYTIAAAAGVMTVTNVVPGPIPNPIGPGNVLLPNPTDTINIGYTGLFSGAQGNPAQNNSTRGLGGPQQSLSDAEATLDVVDTISSEVELAVQSCGAADQDFANYMACLSDSLDTYANALDQIATDLPSGLETVSATIRTAAEEVKAATARATRRLATATTDAQRRAIQRDAVNEARSAINNAKTEIRKAISLIRADDPEVETVQRKTGARIIQAFDTVDTALVRAASL